MPIRPLGKRGALVVGVAGAAAAIAVLLASGPAGGESATSTHAALPSTCVERLLKDWRDGRIQGAYPIPCYHETIRHLPTDVRIYSSAADDIREALHERIAAGAGSRTPAAVLP
jgi:hypothetical protein